MPDRVALHRLGVVLATITALVGMIAVVVVALSISP
jgi:hypothetical protein